MRLKCLEKKPPRINNPDFRGKENRGTLSVYRVVICSSLRGRVHGDYFLLFKNFKIVLWYCLLHEQCKGGSSNMEKGGF